MRWSPQDCQPQFNSTPQLSSSTNTSTTTASTSWSPSPQQPKITSIIHRPSSITTNTATTVAVTIISIILVALLSITAMPPPALDSLPLDVAYNILSHLYQGQHSKAHPYLALSAVSRALNGLIESYTAHLIATRRAQFSSSAAPAQKPTNRRRLLHHIWTYCEFCNRKSRRSAILACELVCCKNCDQTQWPRKITMTEACKRSFSFLFWDMSLPANTQQVPPKTARSVQCQDSFWSVLWCYRSYNPLP